MNALQVHPGQGGRVVLRARTNGATRILIEVEDECGGAVSTDDDHFLSYSERAEPDRTGIDWARNRAQNQPSPNGALCVGLIARNGCIFTIDMPLAPENVATSATAAP